MICIPIGIALGATAGWAKTFNVKDYGAKGDGKTDDTVAIRNAANEANNSGGPSTLYLPKGVYIVENLPLTQTHKNPGGAPFLDKPVANMTVAGTARPRVFSSANRACGFENLDDEQRLRRRGREARVRVRRH